MTPKPKPRKKKALSRELRRTRIADLYLKHPDWSQRRIAKEMGCSQKTVFSDLQTINDEWQQRYTEDIHQVKLRQLASIDRAEAEAWDAFEKSKEKFVSTTKEKSETKSNSGRAKVSVREEQRLPAIEYLNFIVNSCGEQRAKILGYNAPQKHEHSGEVKMTVAELLSKASMESESAEEEAADT